VLDELLGAVRLGESRTLVVRGDAGIGKTALLEYAAESAPDFQVVRAAGVESEMELPFAVLHQLCAPMLEVLEELPGPQREALSIVFGRSAGPRPDRLIVGLAVLSLLAEAAAERPLLCVVDDAQWLDKATAQTLALVARRLRAESVGLVFGARETGEEFGGVPDLQVVGLRNGAARALLGSAVGFLLDERARGRIVAETAGNPLALLELPRGLTATQLAGGFGLSGPHALSGRIERSFVRQVELLPAQSRSLLLIAAAEPLGDPLLVWLAAERLGIETDAAAPAGMQGLLNIGERVVFRHPLVRSAVYRSASLPDRRAAHLALAQVTDPEIDPDRRAWHLATAAAGPDEYVAAELERSADRAQARGGLAAAAAFLQRSVALTRDSVPRTERALAAAQAKFEAGAPDAADELLAIARMCPLDDLQRARLERLRAQIAFARTRGDEVPSLLLGAARLLEPVDLGLARETHLEALYAAMFVGRLASSVGLLETARAAHAAPPSPQPPRGVDLLLDGQAALLTQGYPAGAPTLKLALSVFRSESLSTEEELRWLNVASRAAVDLWDDQAWEALSIRHVTLAHRAGMLSELPIALNTRVGTHLNAGELAAAAALVDEVESVIEAIGSQIVPYGAVGLAAWQGREAPAGRLFDASMTEVLRRGEGAGLTAIAWARAQLYNSLGRYAEALAAAEQASEYPEELLFSTWGLVELIEAGARSGNSQRAADALQRLSESTRACGTDWALGVEARCEALLSDGEVADRLYREGIEHLGRTRVRGALARAHLLYGDWLRRAGRRTDARPRLRIAHEMFSDMGAEGFAERARHELLATGETVRKRNVESSTQLTAQEGQIARLAAQNLTNPEIGTRLFLSPRTVEWHLRKVFTKLNTTSRKQLRAALRGTDQAN
jgi:DNA-binding CsgD family transcriptional regulator